MTRGKRMMHKPKKVAGVKRGPHYLIEFRYSGNGKQYLKRIIRTASKKFRVRVDTKTNVIPHITLYGPFKTNKPKAMIRKIQRICSKYDPVDFEIDGFGKLHKGVVFVKINPSKQLEALRKELIKELSFQSMTSDFDFQEYKYNSILTFKESGKKFDKLWDFLSKQKPLRPKQMLLRLTIIRGKTIFYEYDFMQKRLLNRAQSQNMGLHKKTMRLLREKIGVEK